MKNKTSLKFGTFKLTYITYIVSKYHSQKNNQTENTNKQTISVKIGVDKKVRTAHQKLNQML